MSTLEGRYSPGTRERRGRAWVITTAVYALIGVWFRLDQLGAQMLVDDEWHAVRKLIDSGASGIARHFGFADYCIPLTLYFRWLYEHGALSEWQMRLPSLLAGIALLVIAPFLLRDRDTLSARTHAIWTGLLALSPSLIYFSRTARPYALLALLGVVALLAFRRWQRENRVAWAAVYAIAAVLAAWLHVLSLVFTLWPFAHYGTAALQALRRKDPGARAALMRIVGLGVVVVAALALVLAQPLSNDWASLSAKAATDSVTLHSLERTMLIDFGVAHVWVGVVVLAFFLAGVRSVWRRDPDFTLLVLGATLIGSAVICIARPAWIHHAPVLVRYCAPMLPFLLLFVAAGFADAIARVRVMTAIALMSAALLALICAGPLPLWLARPNQFVGHAIFQFDYAESQNPYASQLKLGPVPAFFRQLGERPAGSVTLIETPARAVSNFMPDPWYQRIHHQNVKYALASPVCPAGNWDEYPSTATGDRFRNMLRLSNVLDGAAGGADYLVLRLRSWSIPPDVPPLWPDPWPDMTACVERVTARLGAPVFSDEQIAVFALKANSAAAAQPAAGTSSSKR